MVVKHGKTNKTLGEIRWEFSRQTSGLCCSTLFVSDWGSHGSLYTCITSGDQTGQPVDFFVYIEVLNVFFMGRTSTNGRYSIAMFAFGGYVTNSRWVVALMAPCRTVDGFFPRISLDFASPMLTSHGLALYFSSLNKVIYTVLYYMCT